LIHGFFEILDSSPTLIVALDRITDPQNFGAIIRSAVAFGADWILWLEHRAVEF
jgi:tRNA G18 (ribose-2'-O)-methylase SpoU